MHLVQVTEQQEAKFSSGCQFGKHGSAAWPWHSFVVAQPFGKCQLPIRSSTTTSIVSLSVLALVPPMAVPIITVDRGMVGEHPTKQGVIGFLAGGPVQPT